MTIATSLIPLLRGANFARYYSKSTNVLDDTENSEINPKLEFSKQEIRYLNKTLSWLSPSLKNVILFKYPQYSELPYSFLEFIQSEKEFYDKEVSETRSLRLRASCKSAFVYNVTQFLQDYIQLSLTQTLELIDILTSKKKEVKKKKTKTSAPLEEQSLSDDKTISSLNEDKVSFTKKKKGSSKRKRKPKAL